MVIIMELPIGKQLGKKYEIVDVLGSGWEGSVYLVRELGTGIERAAKFFKPKANTGGTMMKYYARKLHKLRHCPILMNYHTQEIIEIDDTPVYFLVSEFVEGELLSNFINIQRGKKLHPYQGLHLLYALVSGLEHIHRANEYHGDIHLENIIIERYGLTFQLKLIDIFRWNKHSLADNKHDDIYNAIAVMHEALGGRTTYASHDDTIKSICCGMKRPLIRARFKNIQTLKEHLENLTW